MDGWSNRLLDCSFIIHHAVFVSCLSFCLSKASVFRNSPLPDIISTFNTRWFSRKWFQLSKGSTFGVILHVVCGIRNMQFKLFLWTMKYSLNPRARTYIFGSLEKTKRFLYFGLVIGNLSRLSGSLIMLLILMTKIEPLLPEKPWVWSLNIPNSICSQLYYDKPTKCMQCM